MNISTAARRQQQLIHRLWQRSSLPVSHCSRSSVTLCITTHHIYNIFPTCRILPDHSQIYWLLQVGGQHVWAVTGKLQSMLTWSSDALSRCPLTLGFHDKPYLQTDSDTQLSCLVSTLHSW